MTFLHQKLVILFESSADVQTVCFHSFNRFRRVDEVAGATHAIGVAKRGAPNETTPLFKRITHTHTLVKQDIPVSEDIIDILITGKTR